MPGITWEQSRSSLPVLSPVWHWGDSLGVVLWEQSLLLPLPHKHQQPSEWKTEQSALKRDRPLTPPRASPTPCTARRFRSSSSVTKVYASYGNVNPSIAPRARKLLFLIILFLLCLVAPAKEQESSEWALSELPKLLGFHGYLDTSSRLLPMGDYHSKSLLPHSSPQSFPNWFSICSYIFF